MTPDDPRHGTVAGHIAHQRNGGDYCQPCIAAKAMYDKRRVWDANNGRTYTVSSLGARRRVQALQAVGWSRPMIARECGWQTSGSLRYINRSETITRSSHERIAEAYERICMRPPPDEMAAIRTRTWARKFGYAPPLAWDNIDDPDERPAGLIVSRDREIDPIVVDRLMLCDRSVFSTPAEKAEAMRRWLANGGSEREMCIRMGWKPGRYKVSEVAA